MVDLKEETHAPLSWGDLICAPQFQCDTMPCKSFDKNVIGWWGDSVCLYTWPKFGKVCSLRLRGS